MQATTGLPQAQRAIRTPAERAAIQPVASFVTMPAAGPVRLPRQVVECSSCPGLCSGHLKEPWESYDRRPSITIVWLVEHGSQYLLTRLIDVPTVQPPTLRPRRSCPLFTSASTRPPAATGDRNRRAFRI